MPPDPSISVIVPVYNGAGILAKTLPAMLSQSMQAEWIFVDDGSTDGTRAELARLIDQQGATDKASVLAHDVNKGRAAARNTGVARAKGEYLTFLDADASPGRHFLESMWKATSLDGVVAAVGTLRFPELDPTDPYHRYLASSRRSRTQVESGPIAWRHFLLGLAMLRRQAVDEVGGFDERLTYGEDLEFGARLAARWPHGLHAVSDAPVDLYDLGTLETAIAKMEEFGRSNLPSIVERHPEVASQTGVDVVDSRSGLRSYAIGLLLHPLMERAVRRLLPALPGRLSDYAVRYLLGYTLAHSYRQGCVSRAS